METISPSQIQAYLACPRKFSFRYVERVRPTFRAVALAFGSAIHGALSFFHRKCIEDESPPVSDIQRVFRADWAAQHEGDVPIRYDEGDDPSSFVPMGEALLAEYVKTMGSAKIRGEEIGFRVPLLDCGTGEVLGPDLKGYFDLIVKGEQGDILCEIKTVARVYDENTLRRQLQITAYAYAFRRFLGTDPTIQVIALTKTRKPRVVVLPTERPAAEDNWFTHLAAEVVAGIEAGVFPPNPGWMCKGCEYLTECGKWMATPHEVAMEEARP